MTDFKFPEAILTDHTAVLGKTGGGKTSTEKLLIEQVVDAGFRVCVLDTIKSDWWGITSSADGKKPGLPFKILGGPRGHVPLHPSAGAVIGQLVGSGKLPLSIIDMADFGAGDLQRFFVDFAPALLRSIRGVLYLVIEEAHEIAPKERAGIGAENLAIHWAKKLATAGRSKGIRLVVATQRIQALHNAVLGSCETVITHRLTAPADQEPVVKWLKANTDKVTAQTVADSLSSLPKGTGWLCSGSAGVAKIAFPKFRTYDNTATPLSDEDAIDVKTAPVDQDELRAILGDAVKEAEANDPKRLKAEIARLQADLRKAPTAAPSGPTPAELVQIKQTAFLEGVEEGEKRGNVAGQALMLTRVRLAVDGLKVDQAAEPSIPSAKSYAAAARPAAAPRTAPLSTVTQHHATGEVPTGCAKPLAALAAVYPSGLTEPQWSTAAGYKRSGGTWGTYKSRLRTAGLIELRDGRWFATPVGAEAAGDVEMPPAPGPDLVRWWTAKLPGTSKVAEALIEAWPDALDRDELALRLEMSASGGSFGTYLSRLAGPGLIERTGRNIRLSADAMGS